MKLITKDSLPSDRQCERVLQGKECPYCLGKTEYVDSSIVYRNRSYGMIYLCRPCWAYVGVHKGTKKAKGRLANEELRQWKIKAHAAFDAMWKRDNMKRTHAYAWLAESMGIEGRFAHIGMFNVEQCQQVVDLCEK